MDGAEELETLSLKTLYSLYHPSLTIPNPIPPLWEEGSHLTPEWLLSRMLQRVHLERHTSFEGLPAGLTGEGHVLGVS